MRAELPAQYAESVGNIAKPALDRLVRSAGRKAATNDDRDDAVDKIMPQPRKVTSRGLSAAVSFQRSATATTGLRL